MLLAGFVAFTVAAALTPVFASWARRRNLLDVPNDRSSHAVATPRIGGVALVVGLLAGSSTLRFEIGPIDGQVLAAIAGALAIAAVGLIDDFRPLPALLRLVVHAAVAGALVVALGPASLPWLGADGRLASLLTVLWIVTLTNAYNFMDGIDGIAGAQAIVSGTGWLIVGLIAGSMQIASLGLLLAAASSGFLLYNWHPARVFMGDAGSGFLGFLFASLPLAATVDQSELVICAALLTWPFLFDTALTIVRRLRRGENILRAHRSHLYQRLTITGLPHSRVAVLYSGLASIGVCGAAAVVAGAPGAPGIGVAAVIVASTGLWRYVVRRENSRSDPSSPRMTFSL